MTVIKDFGRDLPVYLHPFHGRKRVDEQLDDWGFDGPSIGPLKYAHTTYCADLKFAMAYEDFKAQMPQSLAKLREDCRLPADGSQDERLGHWDSEWQTHLIEHYIPYCEDMLALEGSYYGDWTVTAGEKLR